MLYLIKVFFTLLTIPMVLSLIFNKKIEITIPIWIFTIVLFIYTLGLFSLVNIAFYIIIITTIISIPLLIYLCSKNWNKYKKNVTTPGLLVFSILVIISYISNKDLMFYIADEYSHWGTIVKNIYLLGGFGGEPNSTILFTEYPPGTAVFEYFMIKLSGSYVEGYAYFGMNILCFSLLIQFYRDTEFKDYIRILANLVFTLLLPLGFYEVFFKGLTVDFLLSVLFATILVYHFTNKIDNFYILYMSLALGFLTLIKSSGVGLAVIIIFIILVDILFANKNQVNDFIKTNKKKILLLTCPLLLLLHAKYSWSAYRTIHQLVPVFEPEGITITDFKELITNTSTFQKDVISKFIERFTASLPSYHYIEISLFSWVAIVTLLFFIVVRKLSDPIQAKRLKISFITIFIGSFVFVITMLIMYLFIFPPEQALAGASMRRYLSTYLFGTMLFITAMLSISENKIKVTKSVYSVVFALVIITFTNIRPFIDFAFLFNGEVKYTQNLRQNYVSAEKAADQLAVGEDSVYLVLLDEHTSQYHYHALRYALTPISIKGTLHDEVTKEEIDQVSHVFIYEASDKFKENCSEFFVDGQDSIKNNTLYTVKDIDGALMLVIE